MPKSKGAHPIVGYLIDDKIPCVVGKIPCVVGKCDLPDLTPAQ